MTSEEVLPAQGRSVRRTALLHVLRICAMVGAPLIGISLLLGKFGWLRIGGRLDGLLSAVYIAGFLSLAIAARLKRVSGCGNAGLVISAIQIIALGLAEVWAVLTAVGSPRPFQRALDITDLFWPFSHVYMLVVGVAAWRARVWQGWPVYMILLCGCALPISMGVQHLWGDLGGLMCFASLTAVPLIAIASNIDTERS